MSKDAVHSALSLETGFLQRRSNWTYQDIFGPFWRLYYDLEAGHRVIAPNKEVVLGPNRIILIPDNQLFNTLGPEPKPK